SALTLARHGWRPRRWRCAECSGRHSIRAAGARRARVTNSSRGLGRVSRALAACDPAAFAGVTTVLPPTHAVVLSTWRPFLISDAGPAPPCPEKRKWVTLLS